MAEEEQARCVCGKGAQFWSGLLEQAFCSNECYLGAKGDPTDSGQYIPKEDL